VLLCPAANQHPLGWLWAFLSDHRTLAIRMFSTFEQPIAGCSPKFTAEHGAFPKLRCLYRLFYERSARELATFRYAFQTAPERSPIFL
jgi:hypothetical protein